MLPNEITIYRPSSTKPEATIEALLPKQAINALEERLGSEAGSKAKKAFNFMSATDGDFVQFKVGDRRVRVRQR